MYPAVDRPQAIGRVRQPLTTSSYIISNNSQSQPNKSPNLTKNHVTSSNPLAPFLNLILINHPTQQKSPNLIKLLISVKKNLNNHDSHKTSQITQTH